MAAGASKEAGGTVARRLVLHCGGFERVAPAVLDRRLRSGIDRFAPLWGIAASPSAQTLSGDDLVAAFEVTATGPDWATATRFATLRWDGLIAPFQAGPLVLRLIRGYLALARFLLDGTIRRYFRLAPRYGYFSLYPFAVLLAALLGGLLVSGLVRTLAWLPHAPVTALVLWAAVALALLLASARALYLDFSLDHWAFAAALARGRVAGLDPLLDRFAAEITAGAAAAEADEVVVSGTSLGAVIALLALARALSRDPLLAGRARRLALLTTGSSLLQIGLHPAARALRAAVAQVAAAPGLLWLEVQSTVDPINFCNTDPVADLRLAGVPRPVVRVLRLRDLMSEEAYRRIRYDHVRLHRQYVLPNGRRHFYDFYLICFGPMPLADRIALGEAAPQRFGEDGSFRAAGRRG
jgi:hypothetical protein